MKKKKKDSDYISNYSITSYFVMSYDYKTKMFMNSQKPNKNFNNGQSKIEKIMQNKNKN